MDHVIIFILGLFFGSLANVLILRLNTGESILVSRSRCFACNRTLRWFELVPVISFFAFKKRCRTCGARISWQYPIVELISGIVFLFLFWQVQFLNFLFSVFFFWLLLVISIYDLRHKIIPNSLVYVSIVFAALTSLFIIPDSLFIIHLLSGLGFFTFLAILWFISGGRWMGFGDAKLALALGLMLGWPEALAAFFFSFWLGAVVGLGWIAIEMVRGLKEAKGVKGAKGMKSRQMPFGPFLSAGGLAAFLWGEKIISWYLSLL